MNTIDMIFQKDTSLWSNIPSIQTTINNRLGWLDSVSLFQDKVTEIENLVEQIKQNKFTTAVLLGMGGSSLAAEVFARVFDKHATKGIDLIVLDSTCADQVRATESQISLQETLFLVSSKSGDTIETMALFNYFYQRIHSCTSEHNVGKHFVAITDKGSYLERLANEKQFLHCFINPSDIGGRFSAISYFGLVPAAILGISLNSLLSKAQQAFNDCRCGNGAGVKLGDWLVNGYKSESRDKLFLVTPAKLTPLIWWVEQLLAESLGKNGNGILPVLSHVESNSNDTQNAKHLHIEFAKSTADFSDPGLAFWGVKDEYSIASHFFHWEFAIAIAGAHLNINPFDEPNVTEAKTRTRELLNNYQESPLPIPKEKPLQAVLSNTQADSYIAVLAYWPIDDKNSQLLENIKSLLEAKTGLPVTINFGPRYLHSTGQLYKGGKQQGVFIVLTQQDPVDLAIPNVPYSFNRLCKAQALGDYQILLEKGSAAGFYELEQLDSFIKTHLTS